MVAKARSSITQFERVNADEPGHYRALLLEENSRPIQGRTVWFVTAGQKEYELGSAVSRPDGRVEVDLRPRLNMTAEEGGSLYTQLIYNGVRARFHGGTECGRSVTERGA
ncbi:hypothetical protein OG693_03895 [Streptomyces sp. NBC_01259]|uniref:hypothetical protein n=1 Tax=Streptomyces sp. NBC_01259 TaxID=2903800 RepID=UPI00324DF6B0